MRGVDWASAILAATLAGGTSALAEQARLPAVPPLAPMDHAGHEGHGGDEGYRGHEDHGASAPAPEGHAHPAPEHEGHEGAHAVMTGALGAYPASREASGTAWQPDNSFHAGLHGRAGAWSLMAHGSLYAVYDWQEGPRGDEKTYAAGMVMGSARRAFGADTLQVRAMLSPDPFMGKSGYPLLLASGETADGATPLVDRQHPHDLFMELSTSYSHTLGERRSVFLYAGLPGEPAFGPPAFMHRAAIMESPEAPIAHHWLDSTHITFGVVTAGWVEGNWKLEASRFHGREPDEQRFDIETGALDSTALRLSYNPTPAWSLQASWADVAGPELLEPDEDVEKWSASAIHTVPFGAEGFWATTLAWGRRSAEHTDLNAYSIETGLALDARWMLFGRAEYTETNELDAGAGHHGEVHEVGKVSAGLLRDFKLGPHLKLGLGGLYAVNFIPEGLEASYDGDPGGAMIFARIKLN